MNGKNDDEEEYNEDNAWGDVKKAKADVIEGGTRADYGSSPGYCRGGRRDYEYDHRYNNDRDRYGGYDEDRDKPRYGSKYDRNDRNTTDFGFGSNDKPKENQGSTFFDFDMGAPAQNDDNR